MTELLPEERLRRVVPLAVRGILAQETPALPPWPKVSPVRRWIAGQLRNASIDLSRNKRIHHHQLLKGCTRLRVGQVAQEQPDYVVVALDPVNFEKPYTKKLEGVSTVHKSTPPNLEGEARWHTVTRP